jgi:hypothetical protein
MASTTRRESLTGAATLVVCLIGSAAAMGQGRFDSAQRGGPVSGGAGRAGETDTGIRFPVPGSDAASGPLSGRGRGSEPDWPNRQNDQELARAAMARGIVVPLDSVLKKAADFVPGDVLDVRLKKRPDNPWIYEIRVLSCDGRIRLVVVDATRNAVLEVRRP